MSRFSCPSVPDPNPAADTRNLELDALLPALRAIRHLAEQRTTARLAARTEVRSETGSPILAPREGQLRYDPACVFLLEMMVSIGCRGKKHIAETWPILFEYLEQVLGSAQSYSVLFIERAVVGLLRLCLIVSESVSGYLIMVLLLIGADLDTPPARSLADLSLTFEISCTSHWTCSAHSRRQCSMP